MMTYSRSSTDEVGPQCERGQPDERDEAMTSDMTPDLQRVLRHYVDCGWIDANAIGDGIVTHPRPAYLLLSSCNMVVPPHSEVQVTVRCYRSFRAHKMVIAADTARFDLTDLKIDHRSQFTRAQSISLRDCVGIVRGEREEVCPDPIRWPLEVSACGSEVIAQAIIAGRKEDPGAKFEILLLGEAF